MAEACQPILDGMAPNDHLFAVLPDAMGNGSETRRLIKENLHNWREQLSDRIMLMAVAQGNNWFDYCATIDYLTPLTKTGIIHGIGIPRILSKVLNGRKQACFYAAARIPNAYIHLLGFSDDVPEDLLNVIHFDWSIDSAVPLRCTVPWQPSLEMEPRPADWFDTAECNGLMVANLNEVRSIIS
jgi:hypothetical protein